MSQRYNDNTKRPKPKENQLGILKIYAFCWKIQQRDLGPGEGAVWVTYLSMRLHLKSCHIFPLKVVVEVDTILLGNDRDNVIADKLLACF